MSGAYDLKDAQVELMASDSVYPTPGYLPYILLSYQSVYGNLYDSVSQIMVAPYDSLIPPLFYEGNTSIGSINQQCTPVPKHMIHDSIFQIFMADSTHPLRQALVDNHLLEGWYPDHPMRLLYCEGDDQVSYLNSVNAFNAWTAAGAPNLSKVDFGNMDHNDCAPLCFLEAKGFFDQLKLDCTTGITPLPAKQIVDLYPNPMKESFFLRFKESLKGKLRIELLDIFWSQDRTSF